ncbi:hypothetical protein [Bdellovibrio sp. HCB209]|uniref:hypothetical protein n=1 Tax=Bdellovibrio sp. HCB209 TaxID=3394354 RepID=UPI0039B65805
MKKVRVLVAREVAIWLQERRRNVRMSLSEASEHSQIPEQFIVQWEDGMPIPVPDFIVLMKVYQVPGVVVSAYLQRLQQKFLGDDFG